MEMGKKRMKMRNWKKKIWRRVRRMRRMKMTNRRKEIWRRRPKMMRKKMIQMGRKRRRRRMMEKTGEDEGHENTGDKIDEGGDKEEMLNVYETHETLFVASSSDLVNVELVENFGDFLEGEGIEKEKVYEGRDGEQGEKEKSERAENEKEKEKDKEKAYDGREREGEGEK